MYVNGEQRKLKIAMLGHKRIPSREGGVEIVVEELSARLAGLSQHVTCYNRRGRHIGGKEFDIDQLDSYKGIQLKRVFTIDKKGLAAVSASASAAFCAAVGAYDIVHFHAEGACAMLWIPHLFKKRCIVTIHGLDHQREKWGSFASWYILRGEKCAVKKADEIIVLSRRMQQYFMEVYGRKTKFIPNGVTRPKLRRPDIIKEKWGLTEGGYLLFTGRIVPEKGLYYLLKAFQEVKTDKRLVIAGSASDTDQYLNELKDIAGGDEKILFTGFVQGAVLDELYSNSYLYILPSDLEGMPLSLLEAMSFGNCCLVSDIPECESVVRSHSGTHKALIFKKADTDDLREKIQLACDRPDLVNRYKAEASEFILSRHNWDDIAAETLKLYHGYEISRCGKERGNIV